MDIRVIDEAMRKKKANAMQATQSEQGVVQIEITNVEKTARAWTMYINIERKTWRSFNRLGKASAAMIENLNLRGDTYIGWYSTPHARDTYIPKATERIIQEAFGEKGNAFAIVQNWQQDITDEKRERNTKKKREEIDRAMNAVKKIPVDFDRWLKRQGEQYIFYAKKQDPVGWCSCCEKWVPIKDPAHRKRGRCKKCRSEIEFINTGKKRQGIWTSRNRAELVQQYGNGIIVRNFWFRKMIRCGKSVLFREEEFRDIWTDGKLKTYHWINNTWYRGSLIERGYRWRSGYVYKKNLPKIFEKAGIQTAYLMIQGNDTNPIDFIQFEKEHPIVEKCAKAGLGRIAQQMARKWYYPVPFEDITDPAKDGELAKLLRIDGARMKRLRKMNRGGVALMWLQEEKKRDTVYPDDIIANLDILGIKPEMLEEMEKYGGLVKVYNYIMAQHKSEEMSANQVIQTWMDYMDMAKKLKKDVTKEIVSFPKHLQAAHNECVMLLDKAEAEKHAEELRKKWPKVDPICAGLQKYEYQSGKYCIVAPKGVKDIYMEGKVLGHCLHTCDIYWERITKQTTYLMFLRRTDSPDAPWYTLEVEPGGNIRQKRTTGDSQNKDLEDALPFLRKWQKHILKIEDEEMKRLAKLSDEQRRTNYAEIRKEQKKVWHGKLQGQLLADVLEADFMEAAG